MRLLLISLILITFTSLSAQFTISADVGYAQGTYNQQPEISGIPEFSGQRDFFGTINAPVLGLEVDYAPATSSFSLGLRLQYTERGYKHFIDIEGRSGLEEGPFGPAIVDYLDIIPKVSYRLNRNFSLSIAPYASVGLAECCNPFLPERERLVNKTDYGINLEGRVHLNRLYGFIAYQRSFRVFDFSTIADIPFSSSGTSITVDTPSSISAIRFGVGYTIIR